jgi:glycosyltransferase involved in cell wall biosynthesis
LAFEGFFTQRHQLLKLKNLLEEFKPTVIWLEHAYLAKALFLAIDELGLAGATKFVYSSHNIEFELAEVILRKLPPHEMKNKLISTTKEQEVFASQISEHVIAVTSQDAEILETWTRNDVIVVQNGTRVNRPHVDLVKSVSRAFLKKRFGLFVASAHPPNLIGFKKYLYRDLSNLDPNFYICVVGGVGWGVKDLIDNCKVTNFTNKILIAGEVSQETLSALISLADAFILPIAEGGGSNLKTAEALMSTKNVLGSKKAFVGFENYQNLDGVFVEDNREKFYESLVKLSYSSEIESFDRSESPSQPLRWETILEKLKVILK